MLVYQGAAFFLFLFLFTAASPTIAQTDIPSTIDQCESLLAADRPIPTGTDAPSIRIVSPADGDVIYGDVVAVTVETQNFDLNAEGRHWHLWANGELMGMVYQESGIIDLAPGTYQICASMGNTDHADVGIPDGITITVQQPAEGTRTPTLAITQEDAPVVNEPGVGLPQILLIIGLGLAAAVGGWWVGSRLPGKKL